MKKVLSTIAIAGVATLALASCKGGDSDNIKVYGKEYASEVKLTDAEKTAVNTALAGSYDITVWVSDSTGVTKLTEKQIAVFSKQFPDVKINATVNGISEADSATQMITDVDSGADIYCFAQDQLARVVQAGGLNELATDVTARVKANNDASAIAASTVAGKVYCYPITSDNGYFMYYDKSVVKEASLDSLEAVIADCEAAGRGFSMELETSAWYNAAFFFGAGCHSNWVTDTTGAYTSVDDDFNSDKGVIALRGMQKLLKSSSYVSSSQTSDFTAATPSAVVVSGTWGAADAKKALGDNYGATDLPSFTVDGESYHIGSFSGNKLMGVKPQKDANKGAVCQLLAEFLASATCQYDRYKLVNWGPSSKFVQAEQEVKDDVALAALGAQSAYATPQGQIHGSWWDIAKTYAVAAKDAAVDDEADLKSALAAYEEAIEALFNMSDEEKEAWSVIGSIGGTNWDTDFKMTKQADGVTWVSGEIEITETSEFKVRQGASWDVNYGITAGAVVQGGDNVKPGQAGTIVVTLVTGDTPTLTYEFK